MWKAMDDVATHMSLLQSTNHIHSQRLNASPLKDAHGLHVPNQLKERIDDGFILISSAQLRTGQRNSPTSTMPYHLSKTRSPNNPPEPPMRGLCGEIEHHPCSAQDLHEARSPSIPQWEVWTPCDKRQGNIIGSPARHAAAIRGVCA